MIKVVESDNPPMRLVLGEDALKATRQKIETFQKNWMNGKTLPSVRLLPMQNLLVWDK